MTDASAGRRIKCRAVAGNFSQACVRIGVDFGNSGEYVTLIPEEAGRFGG